MPEVGSGILGFLSRMLAYIISQPRSGSTVLSALLDKKRGIVCMPESSFPQVLGAITEKERKDKRWLGALYRGSTFPSYPAPPTPLSVTDAEACMEGSNEEILFRLGQALAAKLGRPAEEVKAVFWKTTRTIGLHQGPLSTTGKFIILRRHLHNVFDSQFRVDFGVRNRNPWRYAVFCQSYEHAFSRVPANRAFNLDYEDIPNQLGNLLRFLGVADSGFWETGTSSIDLVAQSGSWLAEANKEFKSTDAQKRQKFDQNLLKQLDLALAVTRPIRPFIGPLRRHFDLASLDHIRAVAREQLQTSF